MTDFSVPNVKPGTCEKCQGSGVFRWGGGYVNGKFTGKRGQCHSCNGTGRQTHGQIKRNLAYNRHKISELGSI